MDGIDTAYLSMANIITKNPVLSDTDETKREYLSRLKRYIKVGGWQIGKFKSAQLEAYKKIIMDSHGPIVPHDILFYKYFILFDLMHILEYDLKEADLRRLERVTECYNSDFKNDPGTNIVSETFQAFEYNGNNKLKQLSRYKIYLKAEKDYISLIRKNIIFRKEEPFGMIVTATMSAGKSTFINAITGKNVCLSQQMACTGKIRCIINKAFEDGFSAKYDRALVLTAQEEELLTDNEQNASDKIVVSTSFKGGLAGQRVIINDSPGVNYSGNDLHKQITDRLIRWKNYNLLIYVMNATQLATNDDSSHLDFVKENIGNTPVLFIINKVDEFDTDEEDVEVVIQRQTEILKQKGFMAPIVCPVSSKAGYMAKQWAKGKKIENFAHTHLGTIQHRHDVHFNFL